MAKRRDFSMYFRIIQCGKNSAANFHDFFFSYFQGDYIWIEPVSKREFDVAIGARVISAEGRKIQVRRNVFFQSR